MKKIAKIVCGLCLSVPVLAQHPVTLRLTYNSDQNRYEVYAKPEFTAKQYTWGPSQVSVVLPAEVADAPISARSTSAGQWLDQSMVYAPGAAPSSDFHGFATPGGKVDVVAGEEVLLFDFILSKGFVEGVRLFDASQDPNSAQKGMGGGDFRSYLSDATGGKTVGLNMSRVTSSARTAADNGGVLDGSEATMQVVAYPNPSPGGQFKLQFKGFSKSEVVQVQLTNLTGKSLKELEDTVENLASKTMSVPSTVESYVLVTVKRVTKSQQFTQKLWLTQ